MLDSGFTKAAQVGTAIFICEWISARSHEVVVSDIIKYNTGVVFYSKVAKPLYDVWNRWVRNVYSSIVFVLDQKQRRMALNDQDGFATAVKEIGAQHSVLPHHWDFRPKW